MLLTATLCAMMPLVVDDIIYRRETLGYSESEYRAFVSEQEDMPAELKLRTLGASNLIFAMPKGSDYWQVKQQIILTCNNKETIRGYQYPAERPGRGARSGPRYEQHRGDRSR